MNEFGKFLLICLVISWISVMLHGFHKWYQIGGPFKYQESLQKRQIEIDSMKVQLDSIKIKQQ